mgnify:CR=1 FL=1
MRNDPPGLYIHIPFCLSKCGYCGFYSVTDQSRLPDLTEALLREADFHQGRWEGFDTVYIGGGTPSLLPPRDLGRLLEGIRIRLAILPDPEVTVEVNPGDLDGPLLRELRRLGVNRLSIGCQSFDDGTLALLGRRHTAREALEAVRMARQAGFPRIGFDLIYGIPGQSLSGWLSALETAIGLEPDHLSCYQLTVEAGTPLEQRRREGKLVFPQEDLQADFFLRTSERLEDAGYRHYEVSNFSRGPDAESRHNRKYWDHTPYLGLGPSAHSFDGATRFWNVRSVEDYLGHIGRGTSPAAASERLTPAQSRLEALMLGFRTRRGIDLEAFKSRHGEDLLLDETGKTIQRLRDEGLVEVRDGFLRPTRAGMAVADSLALI